MDSEEEDEYEFMEEQNPGEEEEENVVVDDLEEEEEEPEEEEEEEEGEEEDDDMDTTSTHIGSIQDIYSSCLLTRTIELPISLFSRGKSISEEINDYIVSHYEGKCSVEGYIKPGSTKVITYSSGIITKGDMVSFEVMFECSACYPVEGMTLSCRVKETSEAGITAESNEETPSPILAFIIKDHHARNAVFSSVRKDDLILIKVIGQRFQLNDKYVSIIGELSQVLQQQSK
jgi:DNA-directed RNA polymerase subunit E'/Rpb7